MYCSARLLKVILEKYLFSKYLFSFQKRKISVSWWKQQYSKIARFFFCKTQEIHLLPFILVNRENSKLPEYDMLSDTKIESTVAREIEGIDSRVMGHSCDVYELERSELVGTECILMARVLKSYIVKI